MKTLIMALALTSFSNAHAIMRPFNFAPALIVKNVSVEGNFMPPVDPETRPVHKFVVEIRACRTLSGREFQLKVANSPLFEGRNRGTRSAVTFSFKGPMIDCMGPTHLQEVELSTSDIPLYSSITVTNSLLVEGNTTHKATEKSGFG